jgi:hypothetical protein
MKRGIAEFWRVTWVAILLAVPASHVGATSAPARLDYSNGISATVYGAEYLASRLTTYQGAPAIELPDGRMIPVITDINDPSIYNKGDGAFHSFTNELVGRALVAVTHPNMPVSVRIYLLPYPRRGVLVSSTSGNEMFLSPHVLAIEPAVAAYIVAHELGHVFHNRYLPAGSNHWNEYRALRGITDAGAFNDSAPHANRPREIFAEDFRVLFGGRDAYFDGHVENTQIVEPGLVAGLPAFYLAVVTSRGHTARIAATCSPNPFNPETEIRIAVADAGGNGGTPVTVRVYSVTGALVRNLYAGATTGDLAVRWDGKDNRGNPVASATYYAQIRMGDDRETLKLVLLK